MNLSYNYPDNRLFCHAPITLDYRNALTVQASSIFENVQKFLIRSVPYRPYFSTNICEKCAIAKGMCNEKKIFSNTLMNAIVPWSPWFACEMDDPIINTVFGLWDFSPIRETRTNILYVCCLRNLHFYFMYRACA